MSTKVATHQSSSNHSRVSRAKEKEFIQWHEVTNPLNRFTTSYCRDSHAYMQTRRVSTSRGVVSLRLFFRVSRPRRSSVSIFLPVFAKVGVAYRGCLRATSNEETRAEIARFVGGYPSSLRFHTAPRTRSLVASSHGCFNRCRPEFLRILRGCKRRRTSHATEYRLSSVPGAT